MGSTNTYALPYPELTDSANVPRDQKALAEAVEAALSPYGSDSGWVNVTINAGFAVSVGNTPQVRRVGKAIYCRGGLAPTGFAINAAHDAMTVPAGYRITSGAVNFRMGTNSGQSAASLFMGTNGVMSIRTNGSLATWYLLPGAVWFLD
jgi:hypothetical protein